MAYAVWSVVFGEQPSAAKWNILGTNDADFNTRTTITRQDDTTNTDKTNPRTLTGWGYIIPGVTNSAAETVTFGVTFAQRPIVLIAPGGDHATATTYGSGNANIKNFLTQANLITTTNFSAEVVSKDGTNWAAGNTVFYQWVAIGEV
jgi:hypothetical protein